MPKNRKHKGKHQNQDVDGFVNYKISTNNPGPWLLVLTSALVVALLCCYLPGILFWRRKKRKVREENDTGSNKTQESDDDYVEMEEESPPPTVHETEGVEESYVKMDEQVFGKPSFPWNFLPGMSKKAKETTEEAESSQQDGTSTMPDNDRPDPSDSYVKMNEEQNVVSIDKAKPLDENDTIKDTMEQVVRHDRESQRISSTAVPTSIQAILPATCSLVCLILISQYIGTNAAVAYSLVHILLQVCEHFLDGSIKASTTLCARAVAAGNYHLAGQYIQMATVIRLIMSIPFIIIWYLCTFEFVLWLEWGAESVAEYAQDYVQIYIWVTIIECLNSGLVQLLILTGHEKITTTITLTRNLVNTLLLAILLICGLQMELSGVAVICLCTSIFFFLLTVVVSSLEGWLRLFATGLFFSVPIKNIAAMVLLLRASAVLSLGSVFVNTEWLVLTFYAADLGPADAAALAMIKFVWDFFVSTTSGINELRVTHYLATRNPDQAKICSFKSIYIGMMIAFITTAFSLILLPFLPEMLSPDQVLQGRFRETLPFIIIGNFALSMAMLSSYVVGGQGRYKLGVWAKCIWIWGLTVPLAAVFVYGFNFNVEGLIAALVIGYVGMAAVILYILLARSNWPHLSEKMHVQLSKDVKEEQDESVEREQGYAILASRYGAARAYASHQMIVFTAPPGRDLGLKVGWIEHLDGPVITKVSPTCPVGKTVREGDGVVSIDGCGMASKEQWEYYEGNLGDSEQEREIVLLRTLSGPYNVAKVTGGSKTKEDDANKAMPSQ